METEEAKLGQQYQKLSGSLTVQFRGEEKTLIQMGRYLEEPDRALREETWRLVAERRLKEAALRLVTTYQSVRQIAYVVGYQSQSLANFRQEFQKRFGMSPKDYRARFWRGPMSAQ